MAARKPRHFVNLLLTAARRPDAPVYVVLTMRSDFLGDCAQFPGLPEALSESQYLIPRLAREQRRQAIVEPLRLFGATMTPQLIEQLLNDSGDEARRPRARRSRVGFPLSRRRARPPARSSSTRCCGPSSNGNRFLQTKP